MFFAKYYLNTPQIVFGLMIMLNSQLGLTTAEDYNDNDNILVHSASCKLLEPGFDIATDNDIETKIASDPTHCCSICEKTRGCNAWAWNLYGPTCYLKSSTTIMPAKDSTTRAGILGAVATCSIHKGFDIAPGNDLSWHLALTPTDCCGICAATPNCTAWTHIVSPPRCYLKSNATLVPSSDETTTAGISMGTIDSAENDFNSDFDENNN